MKNFNANQARHLYIANAVKQLTGYNADPSDVLTSNGDIALGSIPDTNAEDIYFVYKNGDGNITRSDTIKLSNIKYINSITASNLAIKLQKATVSVVSGLTLSDLVGKHVQLTVNLREYVGLDYSERYPIVADVYCDSTNTASATAFYAALADELNAAIAGFATAPFAVSSDASGLVITQTPQKFVRGKFSADPIHFEVICNPVAFTSNSVEEMPWGTVVVADSGSTITGDYRIAELEEFSHYERSESLGMSVWPNNYEWTPLVTPVAGTSTYGMLTIQYYYEGDGIDSGKSERTLQIAASDANITTLMTRINTAKAGSSVLSE